MIINSLETLIFGMQDNLFSNKKYNSVYEFLCVSPFVRSMHVLYGTSFVWRNQITFDVGILFFDLLLVVIPFKKKSCTQTNKQTASQKIPSKKKPEKKKVRYVSRRTALLLLLLLQKNSTSVLSHQVISYNYVNMSPCAAFVFVCASVFVSIFFVQSRSLSLTLLFTLVASIRVELNVCDFFPSFDLYSISAIWFFFLSNFKHF